MSPSWSRDAGIVPDSPEEAWQAWQRHGVVQFRQAHFLQAAGSHLLGEALPGVAQALLRAGATSFNMLSTMPPFITDRAPREGDDRYLDMRTHYRIPLTFPGR